MANDFPWIESRLRWLEKGDQCAEILRSGQIQCRMFEVLREENWDRVRFEFNCLKIHASQNVRLVMRVWVARAHTGMSFFRKKFSILLKLFVYSKDCAIFSCNFFWNLLHVFFLRPRTKPVSEMLRFIRARSINFSKTKDELTITKPGFLGDNKLPCTIWRQSRALTKT